MAPALLKEKIGGAQNITRSPLGFPSPWVTSQRGWPCLWIVSTTLRQFSLILMLLPEYCSNQIIWHHLCLGVPNLHMPHGSRYQGSAASRLAHASGGAKSLRTDSIDIRMPSKHSFEQKIYYPMENLLVVMEKYYIHFFQSQSKKNIVIPKVNIICWFATIRFYESFVLGLFSEVLVLLFWLNNAHV